MKIRLNKATVITLVVLTVAIYARTAYFPFCEIDDRDYVTENSHILAGLTIDSVKWAFTAFHACNWHPLTWLSLMVDSQLFGMDPMGYHLVNVALHAVTTALLFLMFNSTTGAPWRSAFVAACFALHPLHVESVAWISERKDVLSGLFWMLTLISYSAYVRKSKRSMYAISLAVFALGLMAKPMLVTIPVVLLLLDIWPLARVEVRSIDNWQLCSVDGDGRSPLRFRVLLLEKVPYLALAAGSSAITIYAQHHGGAVAPLAKYPLETRVGNALWSVCRYIGNMFYPFDLAIYYPLVPVPLWKAGLGLALVCGAFFLSIVHIRRRPWVATGCLWYLVTLLPVVGLIQVGGQSMADRYTYIPLIGLFVIIAWGEEELCARVPRLRIPVAVAAVGGIFFLSAITWFQIGFWRDNIVLLSHAMDVTKDNSLVSYSLCLAYERDGQIGPAIEQYRSSIRNYPDNPEIHLLHLHLGNLLNDRGKSDEASGHFAEAIRLKPQFWQAYYNMGLALERLGRTEDALKYYNEALEIDPTNALCHNNIGGVLARRGKLNEAIQHFQIALQFDPALEQAKNNLETAERQREDRKNE